MTDEIAVQKIGASIREDELIGVLGSSLYPGASKSSICMVLAYCKACGLDPMQKPVHIVPMWDRHTKSMRDVIMPGIGLYRTQAARSQQYAGVTDPEFGQDITEDIGGVTITYPKYCKVTVKRALSNGSIVEFSATEFWKENYATAGKDSSAPNTMWRKRPYGQISKCAEAQALRKAFPEVGSQPTADEMEGKIYEEQESPRQMASIVVKPDLPTITPEELLRMCADKIVDGEIVKMGVRSMVQSGQRTAAAAIEWVSKKATISAEVQSIIESWEPPVNQEASA